MKGRMKVHREPEAEKAIRYDKHCEVYPYEEGSDSMYWPGQL